jgi:hypothetical protein
MESHLSEEALWASTLAARLRLLQAAFADDDPKQRQTFMAEELDRALQRVSSSRQEAHLHTLEELFPIWGGSAVPASASLACPQTADELVGRLVEAAATLSKAEIEALAAKLCQTGLLAHESQPVSAKPLPEFSKFFGIADDQPLDLERAQKLIVGLATVFLALDQLVWTLWRQLNAKSIYRKEAEFGKLAGPYLISDDEVSSEQIRQALERTRRLIAALLGAMGRSGASFARKHSADLAPESIENAARIEKKAFESLEAASWRKYRELHKEYSTEQTLESQIQQEFIKSAEELLRGIGR